jgi:hypothetical protein
MSRTWIGKYCFGLNLLALAIKKIRSSGRRD